MIENERRHLARLPGPFDGQWNGASQHHHCIFTNVNAEGCFISFIGYQHVGAEVIVLFRGEASYTIDLPAVVMSVEPGIGFEVQFDDPTGYERAKLVEWLAARGLSS